MSKTNKKDDIREGEAELFHEKGAQLMILMIRDM